MPDAQLYNKRLGKPASLRSYNEGDLQVLLYVKLDI